MLSKLFTVIAFVGCVSAQYFKTSSTDFLQKVDGEWKSFGRFGAVNLGVTKPGYQPGDVILRKEDYMIRFKRAEALGVRVIRVYALLHSDFYEALVEWNENNDHQIYVLHGTAFPEYEMEGLDPETLDCLEKDDDGVCIEGADVYNPDTEINEMMKDFIERTVKGVYGGGKVVYKDRTQETANYNTNIAKYLLGWVIGGEIPPTCVNRTNVFARDENGTETSEYVNEQYRTNDAYTIGEITNDASTYVEVDDTTYTGRLTSPFEFWVGRMLDHLAVNIDKMGHSTPISHTNWITTDGITNWVESRVNDNYTESVEDWEEIDFTTMKFVNGWPGYYNQHAYPYYPHLVHERNYEGEEDPFLTYLQRLDDHYHNPLHGQPLPFVITEIGISTSLGVASRDPHFGRNHGGVKESEQGTIMKELMVKVYEQTNITGMVIFQMHDEWFKKSWNTKPYESKERQTWLNVLSAEQGFGIFSTKPDENVLEYDEVTTTSQLEKLSVSSDSAYLHIKVKVDEDVNEGTLLIGLDSWEDIGTHVTTIQYPRKTFTNEIESFISIDIESEEIKFQQLQSVIPFVRNYGEWLSLNEPDSHKANFCNDECQMKIFEEDVTDDVERGTVDPSDDNIVSREEDGETIYTRIEISFSDDCYGTCFNNGINGGDGTSVFDLQPSKGRFVDWRMLVRAPVFMFPGRNDANKNTDTYLYSNVNYTKTACYNGDNFVVECPEGYDNETYAAEQCETSKICTSRYFNNYDTSDLEHMVHDDFQEGIVYKPHTTWEFQPEKNTTFEIVDNEYHVRIPWTMVGYLVPGYHIQWVPPQDTGKKFAFPKYDSEDSNPDLGINIEASILTAGTSKPSTEVEMNYKWKAWDFPQHWCIKAKEGFRDYRSAFHTWNRKTETEITDEEIAELSECYYFDDSKDVGMSIHRYIVITCFIFLGTMFFLGAFGALIQKHILYCYSFQKSDLELEGDSYRLKIINFILLMVLFVIVYIEWNVSGSELTVLYVAYITMIVWDALLIFAGMMIKKWDLYEKKEMEEYDVSEHAFVICCHNSSDVIGNTLKSLLEKVSPETIYVADNGSTPQEQEATNNICYMLSKQWYKAKELPFDETKIINYGHSPMGNKTIAQYASVCNLPEYVKYVTCIDDDTRLHNTWEVRKVIRYFAKDENVAVLAYPLKAEKPEYDVELFQAIEYIVAGFTKIWHSSIWSTIFNSGAFGTYRVEILKEAFQYHNTDFNGDDLQICLNIHQLKGTNYLTIPDKKHTKDYRVATATDMIVSTIVPKCFLHLKSVSPTLFKDAEPCTCDNPDLFKQRSKGWFVSKHRFIPKYLQMIFNCKGSRGIWVRLVAFYELLIILNEYFILVYLAVLSRNYGLWMLEAFMIGITINILAMLCFNQFVLKKNKLGIPMEAITTQPLIYKIFMITIYRYCGLFYHLFVYLPTHKSGKLIKDRIKDSNFIQMIKDMYVRRPPSIEASLLQDGPEQVELQVISEEIVIENQRDPNEPIEVVVQQ